MDTTGRLAARENQVNSSSGLPENRAFSCGPVQGHGPHRGLVVAHRGAFHRADLDDPGVVDHDVEPAIAFQRRADE
jgi:hypothetical protein